MALDETSRTVDWPATNYVFLEARGSLAEVEAGARNKRGEFARALSAQDRIAGAMSLFDAPSPVYRSGVILESPPMRLPKDLRFERLSGGRYHRFVVTGSYAQLPEACARAVEILERRGLSRRAGFCIEHYLDDPQAVPEPELVTHILIPAA